MQNSLYTFPLLIIEWTDPHVNVYSVLWTSYAHRSHGNGTNAY